ncbi:HEAT repeat domain-containing protein [Streptomyces sp. M41]|uniref:HEAT repeat domain-containing protein n=1 Tax=Streptomyces sp. M41 TaxID=3059412 RepID=UPI00374D5310
MNAPTTLLLDSSTGGTELQAPIPQHGDVNDRLVATVTVTRDLDAVRACLEADADPNTPAPDGLPLLCTAVARFDHESVEALTDGGANPDLELPDGTTPLLRAVDLGSPALVDAALGKDPALRLSKAEQQRLLDCARHWCEAGEADELRNRTRGSGPVTRRRITDAEFTDVEEVSLGGLTVRAGHSAILTSLERTFGVLPPVAELVARAIPYPEETHVNWFAPSYVLAHRRSAQAWSDLAALRHHADPVHRRFLAGVLWHRILLAGTRPRQDTDRDVEFLAQWALDESDGHVLAKVLDAYTGWDHAGQEAIGLRYAGHPDPRVRREVPYCLLQWRTSPNETVTRTLFALARDPDAAVRAAVARVLAGPHELSPPTRDCLLTLIRDTDHGVRAAAAEALSGCHDRTPAVMDAFAALLDEDSQILRLEAAYAFARRDDPRTEQAYERVGPLGPGFEHDHRVSAHWYYRRSGRADQT